MVAWRRFDGPGAAPCCGGGLPPAGCDRPTGMAWVRASSSASRAQLIAFRAPLSASLMALLRSSARTMRTSSSLTTVPFPTKSSAPSRNPWILRSNESVSVRTTTGTRVNSGLDLRCRMKSHPSITGIRTSVSTRSGKNRFASARPSSPLFAVRTENPFSWSTREIALSTKGSSSTIRILLPSFTVRCRTGRLQSFPAMLRVKAKLSLDN